MVAGRKEKEGGPQPALPEYLQDSGRGYFFGAIIKRLKKSTRAGEISSRKTLRAVKGSAKDSDRKPDKAVVQDKGEVENEASLILVAFQFLA